MAKERASIRSGMGGPVEPVAISDPPVVVYPRAPLQAVAIEVYFHGVLDALTRFAAFQRRHDEEFDRLYVPRTGLESDEFDLLRPVLLLGDDGTRGIAIASNQLSVITYPKDDPYPGFEEFSRWAIPALAEGLDALEPKRMTRVGFRYENVIDSQMKGNLELERFFRIVLPRGLQARPGVRNDVHFGWRQEWPTGYVSVTLSVEPREASDLILLSIAAERSAERRGPVAREDLSVAIREAHNMARSTFDELITPEFRESLKARPEET